MAQSWALRSDLCFFAGCVITSEQQCQESHWNPLLPPPSALPHLLRYQSISGFLSLHQSPGVSRLLPECSKPCSKAWELPPQVMPREKMALALVLYWAQSCCCVGGILQGVCWHRPLGLQGWRSLFLHEFQVIQGTRDSLSQMFSLFKAALLSTIYSSRILGIWLDFHNQTYVLWW